MINDARVVLLDDDSIEIISGGSGSDNYILYKVQFTDTLGKIALRFHTSAQTIMALNPIIKDPNRLYPGWVLKIPRF